jgi:uridine phosphorylase
MARKRTDAPVHLQTHAPVAERVLLPGDPGRALRLAQALTNAPKMMNHNRGLWGYTGAAADGRPLTVQSTGMGGPSAAIVVEELVALGARRLVRVGTCRALDPSLSVGDLVVADPVLARDGVSAALGVAGELRPDGVLADALAQGAGRVAVASLDLFYGDGSGVPAGPGAAAWDLESAAVLSVAASHGVPAAALLLVSADASGGRRGVEELHAAEVELGRAGLSALS